jgi:hypothetical protein
MTKTKSEIEKEREEKFFKEHFKEIKQLADENNKITLALNWMLCKETAEEVEDVKEMYGDACFDLDKLQRQLLDKDAEWKEKIKYRIKKIENHRGVFKRSHFIIELKNLLAENQKENEEETLLKKHLKVMCNEEKKKEMGK